MAQSFCPYCMNITSEDICPRCGQRRSSYEASRSHLSPGTLLVGRYLIGRSIGEGGFGITYIGKDVKLNMLVAVKEYFPSAFVSRYTESADNVICNTGREEDFEKGKKRFIREANAMAMMEKQPEIVGVKDFFEKNKTAYIVMEYVSGITLKQKVNSEGPIAAKEILGLVEPIIKALENMHGMGLIHRDISPDNLMLEDGQLRLIDFGCAREGATKDETMTMILKHGYSPVEQYQRKGQGPWTDVYSLSATIYFCLTGKVPPQAVERLMGEELAAPSSLGAKLSETQEKALLHGMDVKPKERCQSMEELYSGLYEGRVTAKKSAKKIICIACAAAAIACAAAGIFLFSAKPWESGNGSETTISQETSAEEVIVNKVSWDYDEDTKTLTISGTGAMEDYADEDAPWFNYSEEIEKVVIDEGVTSIGDKAFYCFTSLTEISIAASVTSIGDRAFYQCTSLTEIGVSAESGSYIAVDGVLYTADKSVLVVYPCAKEDETYNVLDETKQIAAFAFMGADNLKQINIPAGVTAIGSQAFYCAYMLMEINVDEENGYYASEDGILFSKDMETLIVCPINRSASACSVPEGVTCIEDYAFYLCTGLTEIILPETISEIGAFAFAYCLGLEQITVPAGTGLIGEDAFWNSGIKSITIEASDITIGAYAFHECGNLTEIYFAGSQKQWDLAYTDDGEDLLEVAIYYGTDD